KTDDRNRGKKGQEVGRIRRGSKRRKSNRESALAPNGLSFTPRSRPEPAAIFAGADKGLDHLGGEEVVVESIQLRYPEVIAVEVIVRRIVRIPSQVTEVFHLHKGAWELATDEV